MWFTQPADMINLTRQQQLVLVLVILLLLNNLVLWPRRCLTNGASRRARTLVKSFSIWSKAIYWLKPLRTAARISGAVTISSRRFAGLFCLLRKSPRPNLNPNKYKAQ